MANIDSYLLKRSIDRISLPMIERISIWPEPESPVEEEKLKQEYVFSIATQYIETIGLDIIATIIRDNNRDLEKAILKRLKIKEEQDNDFMLLQGLEIRKRESHYDESKRRKPVSAQY